MPNAWPLPSLKVSDETDAVPRLIFHRIPRQPRRRPVGVIMKRVIIESPYAAANGHSVAEHEEYARRCMADSLARGEAPLASHLLYTQPGILDDTNPDERKRGMAAGFAWISLADAVVLYTDFGISAGMREGEERARRNGTPVIRRSLDPREGST